MYCTFLVTLSGRSRDRETDSVRHSKTDRQKEKERETKENHALPVSPFSGFFSMRGATTSLAALASHSTTSE